MNYYLIAVWGDVEPEILGPFTTTEERDMEATRFRNEEGDEHGLYPLDIRGNVEVIEISAYSGGFFGGGAQ